jgi:hypothetical protein
LAWVSSISSCPPPAAALTTSRSLRAGGARLAHHRYPGLGHFDLIAAAQTEIAPWIDTRLAESPPAS